MQNAYAQALWKLIEGGATPKSAMKSVHSALEARGRLGLLPRISRAFSRIASRTFARDNVVVYVAHKKDEGSALRQAGPILKRAGIKTKDVEICVDENLIGGWRLEGRELLHDASYKKQLLDIYERVSGA